VNFFFDEGVFGFGWEVVDLAETAHAFQRGEDDYLYFNLKRRQEFAVEARRIN
jgi:hypothetical protein